jgi:membrane-associated phospholipid phosphatase
MFLYGLDLSWVIAIFLMLMIGLSRVFLGAHFILNMFAGWFIGAPQFFTKLKLS